jgi:hypothetical protein
LELRKLNPREIIRDDARFTEVIGFENWANFDGSDMERLGAEEEDGEEES